MSDLRPRGIAVELGGVERRFLFTLNVICELQEAFGKDVFEVLQDTIQGEGTERTLIRVVTALLNDEAEREDREKVTEKEAGWLVGLDNYAEVLQAIFKAYGISMPEPDLAPDAGG